MLFTNLCSHDISHSLCRVKLTPIHPSRLIYPLGRRRVRRYGLVFTGTQAPLLSIAVRKNGYAHARTHARMHPYPHMHAQTGLTHSHFLCRPMINKSIGGQVSGCTIATTYAHAKSQALSTRCAIIKYTGVVVAAANFDIHYSAHPMTGAAAVPTRQPPFLPPLPNSWLRILLPLNGPESYGERERDDGPRVDTKLQVVLVQVLSLSLSLSHALQQPCFKHWVKASSNLHLPHGLNSLEMSLCW